LDVFSSALWRLGLACNFAPIKSHREILDALSVEQLRQLRSIAKDDSRAVTATVIKSLIEWDLVEIVGASIVITEHGRSIDELY